MNKFPTSDFCLLISAGALLLLLATGCASYRMGSGNEPVVDSLYIAPVVNDSEAPQAVVPFTMALKEGFIEDGQIEIVLSESEADGILEVTLYDYDRFVGATQEFDTRLGETFQTVLRGKATLRERNGTIIFKDRRFTVDASIIAGEDLVQAEYQNMPAITRDLAEKIRDAVLGSW